MEAVILRELKENEIELIRQIDRSEEIHEYYVYENGMLQLKSQYWNVQGFEKGELDELVKRQYKLQQEGGSIIGAFHGTALAGVASIEHKRRGAGANYCKMDILYVSNRTRKMGIAKQLLDAIKQTAHRFGAEKLYISATPTKNTVDFYMRNGAIPAVEIDKELYALEPDDIHLELAI